MAPDWYMYYKENKSVDAVHVFVPFTHNIHVIVLLMCVHVGTFPGTQ